MLQNLHDKSAATDITIFLNMVTHKAGYITWGYVGTLLITPYVEFNHFYKNDPQDHGAATNFLGKS